MYISVKETDEDKNIYISDVEIIYAGDINNKPNYDQDYSQAYKHDKYGEEEKYGESLLEMIISFIDNLCVAKHS